MPRKINLTKYLLQTFIMLLFWGTMIHEYGHLIALKLIGAVGYITTERLAVTTTTTPLLGWHSLVFSYGGGILQTLYGLETMYRQTDNETWLAGLTVALQGFLYMWWEPISEYSLGALVSLIITTLIIITITTRGTIQFD